MHLLKPTAIAAICLLLMACSDEGTRSDAGGDIGSVDAAPATDAKSAEMGTNDGGDDGSNDDGATAGVTIQGTLRVHGVQPATFISGVEVCIDGDPSVTCATSTIGGGYTLNNVPDVDSLIKYTHPSYYPMYGSYGKGQPTRTFGSSLLTPTLVSTMLSVVGTSVKAGKGIVTITSIYPGYGAEGTSISLSPTSGEGPYYLDAYGLPNKSLAATTTSGAVFVANVDPGEYTLTYTNSLLTCHRFLGWEDTPGSKLKVKVIADSMTFATVVCY